MGIFHAIDGLCFERLENGDVLVTKQAPVRAPSMATVTIQGRPVTAQVEAWRLSPSAWASVVAAVSAVGETIDTWANALTAHQGIAK